MGFLDSLKGVIGLGTIKVDLFSELFPKTFDYLKKFVPSKYLEFRGEIPDVKVVVREKSVMK